MKFSKKEIEHFSCLARISLTDEEKKKFSQEFSSILNYIKQLQKVNTKNVKPISQITGLENVVRKDEIEMSDEITRKEILDNLPEKERNFVKVKKVFEN